MTTLISGIIGVFIGFFIGAILSTAGAEIRENEDRFLQLKRIADELRRMNDREEDDGE